MSEGEGDFYERVGTRHGDRRDRAPSPPDAPMAAMEGGGTLVFADAAQQLGVSRWAERGDAFYGVGETRAELPAGLYRSVELPHIGPALMRQRIETDNLLELPDDAVASLIAEFNQFWEIGDKFRERGFLHKRGFLLWGMPGGGKTSGLMLMAKRLVDNQGGIVILLDHPRLAACCLQMARKIEPKRPMIAIMEDLDALVGKFGENEYLALLDGEAQVDNICVLATTNYPEYLDPRFTDRPSRFDTIKEVGMPSAAARRVYLLAKEPKLEADGDIDAWVTASDGFSVAHLKELIIAVKCFGQPLEGVVKRLSAMRERRPHSEDSRDRRRMGILSGRALSNGMPA